MKNLKKLVIASFMLVIAFVAVVSSTYAWFTTGKDAVVNNIEIGVVDASKTLLIGKQKGVWSRSVTIKPYGQITPVTLVSNNGEVSKFQQLVWSSDLTPSLEDAQELVEEYVKTGDAAPVAGKTYYTLSVVNKAASFTAVANPDADLMNTYYEQILAAQEYIKASSWDAEGTYYTKEGNVYTKVDSPVEGSLDTYYVKNSAYAKPEGYIKFDLYFQITVNDADDWANTSVQMDLTDLHAFDFNESGEITTNENYRAVSSFRMAVAESGAGSQTVNQIIEGVGTGMTGHYGEGAQFELSNGWLEMLNNSAYNANQEIIEKDTVNEKFALTDSYEDALSKDLYNAENNATGKVKPIDDGADKFEVSISCADGSAAEIVADRSNDGLTKTFKITVYVWMEGWDGDNVNAAASCQYTFGLSFRAN